MKTLRILPLVALPALFVVACKSDDPTFLPLADLCDAYAEELCQGRMACCEGVDRNVCESDTRSACETSVSMLAAESGLSYDGERAAQVREDLRARLTDCSGVLPVGAFFNGTRGAGQSCERSGQCESVSCAAEPPDSALVCGNPAGQPVCEPTDI